jgi:hypothetical protein
MKFDLYLESEPEGLKEILNTLDFDSALKMSFKDYRTNKNCTFEIKSQAEFFEFRNFALIILSQIKDIENDIKIDIPQEVLTSNQNNP